jgi:hypothetical protein
MAPASAKVLPFNILLEIVNTGVDIVLLFQADSFLVLSILPID